MVRVMAGKHQFGLSIESRRRKVVFGSNTNLRVRHEIPTGQDKPDRSTMRLIIGGGRGWDRSSQGWDEPIPKDRFRMDGLARRGVARRAGEYADLSPSIKDPVRRIIRIRRAASMSDLSVWLGKNAGLMAPCSPSSKAGPHKGTGNYGLHRHRLVAVGPRPCR